MSEGGIYPWKVQRIELPRSGGRAGVVTSYANLKEPLPSPPKGQTWVQDLQTREWKVVPVLAVELDDSSPPAVARPADANNDGDDATIALTTTAVAVEAIPVIVEATDDASGELEGGVRYHDVQPTDTFQGVCLRYKVTPTELRRANKMISMAASSTTSLKLASSKLIIPANDRNKELFLGGSSNAAKCPTREEKIATLIYKVSRITQDKLTYSEAVAYLELAEGDVTLAIENVYTDFGWTNGQSSMEEILLREEQITALIANVSRRKITAVNNDNNNNINNSKSSRLSYSEARAYLELADWDVNAALTSIREDLG